MGDGKYTTPSPSRLLDSPQEKKIRETLMKVTAQGQRPTKKLRPNYRIMEHFLSSQHLTTTPTGLLYNNRGLKWEELQGSDSMKESLGEPKKRDKNKDTTGN